MLSGNADAEQDVDHPEPERHEPVAPVRRGDKCRGAEAHETGAHDRDEPEGRRTTGGDAGAVDQQPDTWQPVGMSNSVRMAPATKEGKKLVANRRAGPDHRGTLSLAALCAMAHPLRVIATAAVPSQTASQRPGVDVRTAMVAASRPMPPTAIWPAPETAVKAPAPSIACRMNRNWSAGFL